MASHRIYQYSSIARPLHWEVLTNRAVIVLLPLALVAGFIRALIYEQGIPAALEQGLYLMLSIFGGWALARELNPDDHVAAFLALAFAAMVSWQMQTPGLLVVFASLGLIRMVNRTTGLAARPADSVLVCLLVFWVMYVQSSPQFGLIAAAAYALDGSLNEPQRRQWIFALLCLGGTLVYMIDHDHWLLIPAAPDNLLQWLSVLFLVIFALNVLLLRKVNSVGDFAGKVLDVTRVRSGMLIGLLAALQGLGSPRDVALVVAAIAGISVGLAFRKGFSAPTGV